MANWSFVIRLSLLYTCSVFNRIIVAYYFLLSYFSSFCELFLFSTEEIRASLLLLKYLHRTQNI